MLEDIDLNGLSDKVLALKALAEDLDRSGDRFPALRRNVSRILASIKMLEINICDVAGDRGEDP